MVPIGLLSHREIEWAIVGLDRHLDKTEGELRLLSLASLPRDEMLVIDYRLRLVATERTERPASLHRSLQNAVAQGAQRVATYHELVVEARSRGLDPDSWDRPWIVNLAGL